MQTQAPSLWPYIKNLRPQLRGHVKVYPHFYRKERWYILHDISSGQYLRLSERAYSVVGRFDGTYALEEIFEHANEIQSQFPISTDEITTLLGQLNAAELLKDALPIDAQDVFKQYKSQKQKKRNRAFLNPLSIKIPLLNPNAILDHLSPLARLVFSPLGMWIWIFTILSALLIAIANAPSLTAEVQALSFSPQQLFLIWLIYPFIKGMHELGHGLALKVWGAEVHEMGVNLLLFMPVPYVDATASLAFHNKFRRMLVGMAGIVVELFLAALALFIWVLVEPGLIKEAALNLMLIATFSTLIFNGNPLLRYDGYFILEDWLEIPNLGTRAKKYYQYLFQTYFLKMQGLSSPITAIGEKKWFLLYGFLSPFYRLFILFGIALYLSNSFLALGVALAAWVIIMQLIVPLAKGLHFLIYSKQTLNHRKQGLKFLFFTALTLLSILFLPFPSTTFTQGVISTTGEGQLSAKSAGFVKKLYVQSGTPVEKGRLLLELEDPDLEMQYRVLQAKIKELEVKISQFRELSRVKSAMFKDDLHSVLSEYNIVKKEVQGLKVYAQIKGTFVLANTQNPLGKFFQQGEVIAYVINPDKLLVKAIIPQARIGLLQNHKAKAEIILYEQGSKVVKSEISRETPQAIYYLPSPALASNNGGKFRIDPSDKKGTRLDKPMFQIELNYSSSDTNQHVGERVYVRLHHGSLPLIEQIQLQLSQLFLRHLYSQ